MNKPGYKTTEFWITTIVTFFGILMASGVVPHEGPWAQVAGLVASTLAQLGYTAARGQVKSGGEKPPEI